MVPQAIRTVYSGRRYVALAGAIFSSMMLALSYLAGHVFFYPFLASHVPHGTELGLVLIVALSALSALVIPMNVYRVSMLRSSKQKMGGGILGSAAGSIAGACSCGQVGFAIVSTFGAAGATATAFLTNYEVPIRIAAIAILAVTYYTTTRSLAAECRLAGRQA